MKPGVSNPSFVEISDEKIGEHWVTLLDWQESGNFSNGGSQDDFQEAEDLEFLENNQSSSGRE